jgi:nitrate reductase gamma subunit
MKSSFLFAVWPYIAVAWLLLGTAIRYSLSRRRMAAASDEMADTWAVFGRGRRLWTISLLVLFAGHIAGLLFPTAILRWNAIPVRLYLLEGIAFAAGLTALGSWVVLAWRHLGRSGASLITELSDTLFLALLFVSLLSGLIVAAAYRWGSSWGVITLSPYVISLWRGRPVIDFAAQMPFFMRLHIFSAFAAVAVVPLTRLSSVMVVALHRSLGLLSRPISGAAHGAEAWLHKHNPASWLWPEED